ncbi:3,4-dihydroxy-2-butanone-4-phosphate synthase [Amycolatopsis rhabdoformis]|uniref:3,4-dihydroxy-2-butanone-4-phosphate synthase n=1 Tax=Amycolatopsis rhabdoformis TaxID=1448059 RepID=A0ABZ1HV07_9PSEU|nr:3,4-dihydroxy-2-butanone-4-phosphate synthase [Amycolatopsis rhabdoformis]WSE26172.1 3,4-dihydroxy-2-butanone-4-phosphate synthase [Amycolatopsis rhabdoformis]
MPELLTTATVDQAAASLATGRPVVIAGAHGDLVFAAEDATPSLLAFTVRHTDGFVCVALPDETCDYLGLPAMHPGTAHGGESFAVTVDAAVGGTGISATDRAHTLRQLASPTSTPADFTRPGHVVPIRVAASSTVAGRAEAALDLVRLAGKSAAAVLCGLVSQRSVGDMASPEELAAFAEEHSLLVVSAADVLAPRRAMPSACPHCGHPA